MVAIKGHTRAQVFRHTERIKTVAVHTVHTESLQLMVVVDETETVAIHKAGSGSHIERNVAPHLLHLAHIFSNSLGRVEGDDVGLAAIEEIIGVATVECLLEVGGEMVLRTSHRRPTIFVWIFCHDFIQFLTVGRNHILHIVDILEPSLYLERGGSRIGQFQQMVYLAEILEREEMALVLYLTVIGIHKVELHAAELGTFTTVGRTPKAFLRGIAHPRIADTEGTMHKHFQLYVTNLLMDGPDFLQ